MTMQVYDEQATPRHALELAQNLDHALVPK
jgi:hypothetical protein